MAMCHELPYLPLDKDIPLSVLQRRGAISFSSSTVLFSSQPRLERRGAISYEKTDKAAIYVRTLGDVRVHSTDLAKTHIKRETHQPKIAKYREERIEKTEHCTGRRRMPARLTRCSSCCQRAVRKKRPQVPVSDAQVDDTYPGQARTMLERLGRWDFDMFHLEEVTGGHSLQAVGMKLFEENGLISEFQLDPLKLWRCFALIESGYHSHPYHNSTHAADVTQAMHCYLQETKLRDTLIPLEVFAALIAAAAHDLDHPGVSQAYLIATNHHLSELYENSSVLENHHWRCCISVLTQTGLLDHIPNQQWRTFIDLIQSMILATDIARQQEFLSKFQDQFISGRLNLRDGRSRKLVLQMALKCADICNPSRPWETAKKWAERVCQEFFNQGDRERREGLAVSPTCNKYKITTAQIQQGFLKWVVQPLFKSWNEFSPSTLSHHLLETVDEHHSRWTEIVNSEEKNPPLSASTPSSGIVTLERLSKTVRTEVSTSRSRVVSASVVRSKVEKRKMEDGPSSSPPSAIIPTDNGQVNRVNSLGRNIEDRNSVTNSLGDKIVQGISVANSSDERISKETSVTNSSVGRISNENVVKCNNHQDAMPKMQGQDGLQMQVDGLITDDKRLQPSGTLTNHAHPPRSPRPRRKEWRKSCAEKFQLRLTRSPVTVRKGVKFDDPWERQPQAKPGAALHLNHTPNSSVIDRRWPAHKMLELKQSSASVTDPDRVVPGLNNNIESYIPHMDPFAVGLNQNMSHSTTEVIGSNSPPPGTRALSRNSPKPYSSPHLHTQYNSLQSLPNHQQCGHTSPHNHRQSGYTSQGERGHLDVPHRTASDPRRRLMSVDSRVVRGSPYIQRRMAQRDDPLHDRHSATAYLVGGLSPRMPSKTYDASTSPGSPPPLYSVPPALSPLMNDFTSDQMASIARRKQQREASVIPSHSVGDR